MTNGSLDYFGLVVDSFWRLRRGSWFDYFFACGKHIFPFEPFHIREIPKLPPKSEIIPVSPREPGTPIENNSTRPSKLTFGAIEFIGTEFGDDISIFFDNGAAAVYFLDSDPQPIFDDRPQDFQPHCRLLFVEPNDFELLGISKSREQCDRIDITLLPD